MTGFIMFLHAIVCIFLVLIILMQSGRGGGLTEGFASAESMFGTQTNKFLTRTTTVLCCIFFATCLGIAVLSAQQGKSLMPDSVAPAASSEAVLDPAQAIMDKAAAEAEETLSGIMDGAQDVGEDVVEGLEAAGTEIVEEVQDVVEAVEEAVPTLSEEEPQMLIDPIPAETP